MEKAKVAVFIGSASDEATVAPCADILKKLGIPFRFTVTSAHRTPERTAELVDSLEAAGCEVFICAAGMAAHLAGAVAARTHETRYRHPCRRVSARRHGCAARHRADASRIPRRHRRP